jgi:hypothetical protein
MAAAFPSGYNTFVPSFDASGKLVVAFSRNPKDFALNQYVTITPVKKSAGYYLRVTAEMAARVLNSATLADFVWPDGNDAPSGAWGTESHSWFPFSTVRYAYPFRIGYKAEQQADWKILALHAAFAAQDAMTARSVKVVNKLFDSSQYDSSHVSTTTALGGGFWSAGTGANPIIKKCINLAAQQINKDTLGRVKMKDLQLVIDPVIADAMSRSQEIHQFLGNSVYALAEVRGDSPNQNAMWNLPSKIYGVPLVVEDAVQLTSRKGATRATQYVPGGNTAAIVTRQGGLTSEAGGPSFGTIHLFAYEEMTVEQKDDPDHRRISGRVVDDFDVQVVAPATGYVFTHVLS